MPIHCVSCGKLFPFKVEVQGRLRNLAGRTHCLDCNPFSCRRKVSPDERRTKNLTKQRAWVARRRKEDGVDPIKQNALNKKKAVVVLVGGCQICGYSKSLRALAFHHMRDKVLSLTLREFQGALQRLIPELMKCVVLCTNCHAEVHDGLIRFSLLAKANVLFAEKLTELA